MYIISFDSCSFDNFSKPVWFGGRTTTHKSFYQVESYKTTCPVDAFNRKCNVNTVNGRPSFVFR